MIKSNRIKPAGTDSMRNQKAFSPGLLIILMQVQMSQEKSSKMIFGQIHYSTTWFLTWMMRKGKEKRKTMMKRKKDWKILMKKGIGMKVKKMKMMMTNGMLMDSNRFNFLQSLGASCSLFFSSCTQSPLSTRVIFEVSFLLYTMVHNLFLGKIP